MQVENKTSSADAIPQAEAAAEGCDVIPIDRARELGRAEELAWLLGARLATWDLQEASGPHVVIARGEDARCFGPYASRAVALAAANAEAREWEREFPDAAVSFEVAPLLHQQRIAPGS